MSKDEIDEMEAEAHRTLERLDLDPDLVAMMAALWAQQFEMERRMLELH